MSRTHRAHLSPGEAGKRGGKEKPANPKTVTKTHKQKRPNDRAKLKKEYL